MDSNVELLKQEAKRLLQETDWTQLADVNLANKEAFDLYRGFLRNLVLNPVPYFPLPPAPEPIWAQPVQSTEGTQTL